MDWLRIAKELKVGQTVRVKHDCNPNGVASLAVTHDVDCYRAYCFRCKEPGLWEPKQMSLADRLAAKAAQREADSEVMQGRLGPPPSPRNTSWSTWPAPAHAWLLKAGFSRPEAELYGIYHHDRSKRVIVPYQGTHHWQARAVMPGAEPKYIADKMPRECAIIRGEVGFDAVTLTEDLLSAYKVNLAGYHSMPLCGTGLHDEHLALLVRNGCRVIVWLDPDKPGQEAAAKIMRRLQVFDVQAVNLVSDTDPKLYTREGIRHMFKEIKWR